MDGDGGWGGGQIRPFFPELIRTPYFPFLIDFQRRSMVRVFYSGGFSGFGAASRVVRALLFIYFVLCCAVLGMCCVVLYCVVL